MGFFLSLAIRTRSLRSSGVDKIKQLCAPMTADMLNHWLLLTLAMPTYRGKMGQVCKDALVPNTA